MHDLPVLILSVLQQQYGEDYTIHHSWTIGDTYLIALSPKIAECVDFIRIEGSNPSVIELDGNIKFSDIDLVPF